MVKISKGLVVEVIIFQNPSPFIGRLCFVHVILCNYNKVVINIGKRKIGFYVASPGNSCFKTVLFNICVIAFLANIKPLLKQ